MLIQKKRQILWTKAIDTLSAGAYYLLGVLWYKDIDVTDKTMREVTGYGVSTHGKYKKELVDNGYLVINQIGKGKYKYIIGEAVNG
jgi:hypothetical protein